MQSHRLRRIKGKAAFALPFFLAVTLASPALAAKNEEITPYTPWHVEWTKKTCLMRRGFGDKENPVVIQFERFVPGDSFQLVLLGSRLKTLDPGERLRFSYGAEPPTKLTGFMKGTAADGTATIFLSSTLAPLDQDGRPTSPVTPAIEAAASSINMAWAGNKLVLKTGPLDKPFAALRTCMEDLVRSWGLDPAAQQSLTRHATPKGNPARWATPNDYPGIALATGQQAIVTFRLVVGTTGKPTACEIQRSYSGATSGDAFDKRTCTILMERALFEPALDAAGKPVLSYYVNSVRWIIP